MKAKRCTSIYRTASYMLVLGFDRILLFFEKVFSPVLSDKAICFKSLYRKEWLQDRLCPHRIYLRLYGTLESMLQV